MCAEQSCVWGELGTRSRPPPPSQTPGLRRAQDTQLVTRQGPPSCGSVAGFQDSGKMLHLLNGCPPPFSSGYGTPPFYRWEYRVRGGQWSFPRPRTSDLWHPCRRSDGPQGVMVPQPLTTHGGWSPAASPREDGQRHCGL